MDLGIGGLFAYLIKEKNGIREFFENTSTSMHAFYLLLSIGLMSANTVFDSFTYGNAVGRLFISASFALIVSAQAMTKKESPLTLQHFTFANKWGKYTYGIYLIHPIAILSIDILARALHLAKNNFSTLFCMGIASFILTLFLSKMSYHYYELRFLRLKERFSKV
jgi:peptidoglycan/LPS O-acetylase OafA/YrhL